MWLGPTASTRLCASSSRRRRLCTRLCHAVGLGLDSLGAPLCWFNSERNRWLFCQSALLQAATALTMDEFGYLSVLLSIIIGLAVTEILRGMLGACSLMRQSLGIGPANFGLRRFSWVCTQTWWAMFDLRNRHDWEFDQFVVLLTQTIMLYLVAGLVFPDFKGDELVDMRAHYFRQRKRSSVC